MTLRWFRHRPLQMVSSVVVVFLLGAFVGAHFAQQDEASVRATSDALTRIEAKLDRLPLHSSPTPVDGDQMDTAPPIAETAAVANRPAAQSDSRGRDRTTDVCHRVSAEQASYVILRCR